MKCAWNELLRLLPLRLRQEVDRLGADSAQEIRLRLGSPPTIQLRDRRIALSGVVKAEDIHYVVNAASQYSPWSSATASDGYITAAGGHRVGICGEVVRHGQVMTGFRIFRSVNIRVARDYPNIAAPLAAFEGNLVILGPPGSGKTTLLRDLIRQWSKRCNVSVVDERGELFPDGFDTGEGTDVLTGCGKEHAVMTLLRTMTPDVIAVDEITDPSDTRSLLYAFHCGVRLLATAHAENAADFCRRGDYRAIAESGAIDRLVILDRDKSYRTERLKL